MAEIQIAVINKHPSVIGDIKSIVADNSDYTVRFSFDDQWEDGAKTVLFVLDDGYVFPAVKMTDDAVPVPRIQSGGIGRALYIGVMQGDIRTSSPAGIAVKQSISDMITDEAVQPDPSMWEDVLARLEELEANGGGTVPAGTDLVGHAMVVLAGASYDALEMQGIMFPPDVTDEADQQRMLRAGAVKAVVSIFEGDGIAEAGVLDCIEGDGLTWVFAGVVIGKTRTAFVTVQSIGDSNEYEANVLAVHEGGGSSGGDAMRLKVLAELPYEGTPPIIDMIDFTREYTFADIAEAFVAGRTITLNTEYDVVPFQYGMFQIDTIGSRGIEFHGHYWRVPDVEADVDEGWVPAVAFLREDGTLTVEDREWSGYAKQAEVDSLSEAIVDKLDKSGGTLGGKFVIPTADTKAGFVNSEDMKIFGYGANNFRMGDPNKPLELRGSGTNPMFGSKKILVEGDITDGLLTVETITVGDNGETETIPVTGLSLDLTTYSAKAGDGFYINPVIAPSNATNKSVSWRSNATNIATVNDSGYVECIAEGNAVITCTTADGGFTATCAVTITAADGGDNEEGGETTGQKIQFSTLERTSGGIKADGTAHTLGGTYYVEIPYTDGMVIRTLWNGGWVAATYPPILVKTGDVYTPHSVEYVLKDNGKKETMSVGGKNPNLVESTTLTGYGDGSTVIVGMLIGDADESKMDSTDYLYYIPGGEA